MTIRSAVQVYSIIPSRFYRLDSINLRESRRQGGSPPAIFISQETYLFIATVFFAEPRAGTAVPGSIIILSAIFCLKIASVKADAVAF